MYMYVFEQLMIFISKVEGELTHRGIIILIYSIRGNLKTPISTVCIAK